MVNTTLMLCLVFILSGFTFRFRYGNGSLSDFYIAYNPPAIEHLIHKVVKKVGGS